MSSQQKDYIFEPFKVTEVKYRDNRCPRPRSGHRIACDDGNIYCFGGYNPSLPLPRFERENATWTPARPLFKELWSFSIARRKWKRHKVTENMPDELASNAMCMNGRYLMVGTMLLDFIWINCSYLPYVIINIQNISDFWWYRRTIWK